MRTGPKMRKTSVLIVAAGRGRRAGGSIPKQYVRLGGQYVLTRTLKVFLHHPLVSNVAVVIHPDDKEFYQAAVKELRNRLSPPPISPPVNGGQTRQESVYNGLKALEQAKPDLVLIHDAARPFVDNNLISRVIEGLLHHEVVLPTTPVTDTIKQVEDGLVTQTLDRNSLFGAQTPQGFTYPLILDLHQRAANETGVDFTDDTSIAEWAGVKVLCVEGNAENQKLTTKRDMQMAELQLGLATETRTGQGFDVHRFEEDFEEDFEKGDGVILCGVKIPFGQKLQGHSDADVAMHALTDALYGAIGAGDIGTHFPPHEAQWKGAASSIFLKHAVALIDKQGGKIINIDVTIICELPKIAPHREKMREKLSQIMGLGAHRISIKATTTEQLGFTGRGEGIAAQAIASIELPSNGRATDV